MDNIKPLQAFGIRLTLVNDLKNGFTRIGGAAWATEKEQSVAWANIPEIANDDSSDFIADLMAPDGFDVLDEKRVTAEVCERLMGLPIATLIEQGRENTCYTIGEVFTKHPELREEYPALATAG